LGGILAVFTGHLARLSIRKGGGKMRGSLLALVGITTGYVWLILGIYGKVQIHKHNIVSYHPSVRFPTPHPSMLPPPCSRFPRRVKRAATTIRLGILASVLAGTALPASAGLKPQALRDAADYSASRRGCSLLVLQRGAVLLEEYPNGGGAKVPHQIYSGTKTFFTMATLVAEQEGLLHLDEPVCHTITEWRDDPLRNKITIRELMNFSDGLDPAFHLHSNEVADRNALALRTPVVAARGAAFIYGPSHGQVLCEVLRRKLASRGETPYGYLQHKVLTPLGLGSIEHRSDAQGMPLVASGMRLTARQWSAFGLMILGRGSLGKRVIVHEHEFAQCFVPTRINPMFGLGFWLNTSANHSNTRETDVEKLLEKRWQEQDWHQRCICTSAPTDMVAAVGSGYNRLFVIPSLELVIVRQGSDARFSDTEFLRRILHH